MKTSHESDGRYRYGYTEGGLFTLLDHKGEPLYPKALPLLDKTVGNLIWSLACFLLLLLTNLFFPLTLLSRTNPLLMALLVLALFFFGCRLTQLMMIRPLKPLFFPPLWMRVTRAIAKGAGHEVLEKHRLTDHPGLLANLALAEKMRMQTGDLHCK